MSIPLILSSYLVYEEGKIEKWSREEGYRDFHVSSDSDFFLTTGDLCVKVTFHCQDGDIKVCPF